MQEPGAADTTTNPWAPGGAMSASATWAGPPAAWDGGASGGAGPDAHEPHDRPTRLRRIAIGLAAVLAAVSAVVVTTRAADGTGGRAADDGGAEPLGGPRATTAGGTAPATTAVGAPGTTVVGAAAGDDPASSVVASELEAVVTNSRPPVTSLVDLAPELARLDPTEIVALDVAGNIVEVSIPSGRVRTTAVGFPTERSELIATDAGALVWPMPGGSYFVLGTDGERGFVDDLAVDLVRSSPGLDRFYVWHDPPPGAQPDAAQDIAQDTARDTVLRSVDATGDRAVVEPAAWLELDPRGVFVDALGALVVNDTAGAYRIDEAGTTTRISTGDVIATGRNHVVLRECDEQRRCSLVAVGADGVRTPFPIDLPTDASAVSVGGLSPSGDALLMIAERTAVDVAPQLIVVELADGTRRTIGGATDLPPTGAWAEDSSGVFVADVLLRFVDRFTGSTVVVSADLPKLHAVATRAPRRSPTCELLAIAMPAFDEMRIADDGSVAPPPIEVLRRLEEIAPGELATAIAPTIDFVDAFVSDERPGSGRVGNWPAEVGAGLAALDAAAAGCGFPDGAGAQT